MKQYSLVLHDFLECDQLSFALGNFGNCGNSKKKKIDRKKYNDKKGERNKEKDLKVMLKLRL